MLNHVEGIILDWAGTTVDFGCFAPVNVFLEIFKNVGVEVTTAEARKPMGMLKRDHIKTMLEMPRISSAWKEKFGHDFNEADVDIVDMLYRDFEPMLMASLDQYTDPIPGVVETINVIRRMGLKIGSTTGYTDTMMQTVVKGAKDKGYSPDNWVTPDSTKALGRPYPYMIFRNMEILKLSAPWKVVKIGDTIADINEGVNAGVWSVGVIVGSSQMGLSNKEYEELEELEKIKKMNTVKKDYLKAGADFVINTLVELPLLLTEIDQLIEDDKRPHAF
ncbi:phosphonoacetaldehyde hydrolase [Vallitalea sediminicola]